MKMPALKMRNLRMSIGVASEGLAFHSSMIFSDLPSPAEAGFAKARTGIHPRVKSKGMLFGDHAPAMCRANKRVWETFMPPFARRRQANDCPPDTKPLRVSA
jgi:hypothetical protein